MPILCEPAASAEGLIQSVGGEVRAADSLEEAANLLDSDPAETLVVIGPQTATDEALAFASALRMVRPAVGVVLVRDQVDVAVLSKALQSGVREVVAADDSAALATACRRSRDVSWRMLAATTVEHSAPKTEGQIVTVFTAKGGVGKTMLAINPGVVLAQAAATGSAWLTLIWPPATWRSACCSTRRGAWPTRCPWPGAWTPPEPLRC